MGRKSFGCMLLVALFSGFSLFAQNNVFTRICQGGDVEVREYGALFFLPESGRFLATMGRVMDPDWRYSELSLKLDDRKWINLFPDDSLFGKWGDSTGLLTALGKSGFTSPYFHFSRTGGYLRPYLEHPQSRSYYQFAYDSDSQDVYVYVRNKTACYHTATRRWDTLSTPLHPTNAQGGTSHLLWGSMCYDPVNKEVLCFGGGNVDAENGHFGTWVFKTAAKTWEKLDLAVQPPPRNCSPMVYDAKNRCIVLFGGDHSDFLFSDTWIYDCAARTWIEKHPSVSPSPRMAHALLYLPKSQSVVLLGGKGYASGTQGAGYPDIAPFQIWRYDPASDQWGLVKVYSGGETFPVQNTLNLMAACDTADNLVVLGDTSGGRKISFSMACDPTVSDPAGTASYGVAPGALGARSGGYDPAWYDEGTGTPNPDSMENVLADIPLNTWVLLSQPKQPAGSRGGGTLAFDCEHDQILNWNGGHSIHCGTDVAQYSPGANRWHIGFAPDFMLDYNGSGSNLGNDPQTFTFNNRPFMPGHTYHTYCYSPMLHRMVYIGPKYTFTYDPVKMDWDSARILNHPNLTSHMYRTSLWNTAHGVLCWNSNRGSGLFLLDSTCVWRELPVTGEALPCFYTWYDGAAYDIKRDRMLFMGGCTQKGQIWSYDFATSVLSKLNPEGDFDSLNGFWAELVYLPAQDKILVEGDPSVRLYDCEANRWELMDVAKSGAIRTTVGWSMGCMYDPKRDLVWGMFEDTYQVFVMRVAGGYPVASEARDGARESAAPGASINLSFNPFNPSTLLVFTMEKACPAVLSVYDVRGKKVRTLFAGQARQGRNTAIFNAADLPSGLYVARLIADGGVLEKKMTLIK